MVHEHDGTAELQMYGVRPEEVIYSVSRAGLNRALVEAAASYPNVELRFGQLCIGLAHEKGTLEMRDEETGRIYEAAHRPTIATDGAGSAVRDALRRARGVDGSRRAARSRLQGTHDSGARWQTRDGSERAAHLAARRIHADRAAQSRRHVHRHAVSGAHRREQFRAGSPRPPQSMRSSRASFRPRAR